MVNVSFFQSTGLNWAMAANSMDQGGAQKSLAEIQAEEQRQERDRQERERREKKARQKGKEMLLNFFRNQQFFSLCIKV